MRRRQIKAPDYGRGRGLINQGSRKASALLRLDVLCARDNDLRIMRTSPRAKLSIFLVETPMLWSLLNDHPPRWSDNGCNGTSSPAPSPRLVNLALFLTTEVRFSILLLNLLV
jgi:hypothetical protein